MEKLSSDELKQIALEKSKKGVATKRALQAQEILYERAGGGFIRNYYNPFTRKKHTSHEYKYDFDY